MNEARRASGLAVADSLPRRVSPRPFPARARDRVAPFLCVGLLWLGAISFAAPVRHVWPEDMTPEQRYWHKVQEEKAEEARKAMARENAQREAALASVESLVQAGAAVQPQLILAQDGPPVTVQPSWFDGKKEYLLFGIIGSLLAGLIPIVLVRHHREAEIRALTGGYLSDGTEVASFKMPEIFAPLPPMELPLAARVDEEDSVTAPATDPREAFFASFPEYLTQMRESLQELGRTTDEAAKQKLLADMAELIGAFKVEANLWQLRPIMQVSTVLELLLQRLAGKTKDVTDSTLRTVAGALDLLADLAVPDLPPDLLIMPPLKILAVDDEPLCLRALAFALQKANLTPDLARNGQEAVALAESSAYDVVFMDIQMPEMDGFTACEQIHQGSLNTNTPVVFVTVQSDFATRAKSNLIGGRDFMAKPFLIFELTMKAVTYAARKRLRPTAAPRPRPTRPAIATPKKPEALVSA